MLRRNGPYIHWAFDFQLETSLWPAQPVRLPHSDLVKVMELFPSATATAAVEHFEVTTQQAMALRRRFVAMAAIEQNFLSHIR